MIADNSFKIRLAVLADLENILLLHHKYLYDNIDSEERSKGFVRVTYNQEQIISIIKKKKL